MSLFRWECRKIWGRRSARIALCIALAYAFFLTCFNGISNLSYETHDQKWSGPEEIQQQYRWAEAWAGPLTGEKLAAAKQQYDIAFRPENLEDYGDGSSGPTEEAFLAYVRPLGDIPAMLQGTFGWLPQYETYAAFRDVPADLVLDYYGQRDAIVESFLKEQVLDGEDRAFFLAQNAQVETPFAYDWVSGQRLYLSMLSGLYVVVGLLLCIAIAPIFAGEYQERTDSVLLCAKRGRGSLALAKLVAALSVATLVFALCTVIYLIGQLAFVGLRGLDCPVQLIKPIATAPLTIVQAEGFGILYAYLATLAAICFTLLLSSRMRTPFPVIVLSMLTLFVPSLVSGNLPDWLNKIILLMPFASDSGELFRTNMYHIAALRIWSPDMMILASAAAALLFLPFAVRGYVRHQA